MKKVFDKNIYFVKNKDFHTIQIKIGFPFFDTDEDMAHLSLLPALVSYMNEEYNTEESFQKNKQKNYILATGCSRNVIGKNVFFTYSMIIPNKNALGLDMLDKQFDFFEKFVYHPKIVDGGFDAFELEREKKDLKMRIANGIKNLRVYRNIKFVEAFDTIGIASRGIHNNIDLIDKVTPYSLYKYYQKVISNNKPLVFVFGDFDEDEMTNLINKYLIKDKDAKPVLEKNYNFFLEPRENINIVNDKGHFKDSAISLAYKVKDMSEDDFTKLNIVSNLLSSMSSRLLQKVLRDEFELVYSANSCCHMRSGVLEITAYINKNNKELVIEKIKEIVLSLKDEVFITEFLNNIIERKRINLLHLLDDKLSLLDEVICKELEIDLLAKEQYELIKEITPKDISLFIDRLVLDTIYFVEEEDYE